MSCRLCTSYYSNEDDNESYEKKRLSLSQSQSKCARALDLPITVYMRLKKNEILIGAGFSSDKTGNRFEKSHFIK